MDAVERLLIAVVVFALSLFGAYSWGYDNAKSAAKSDYEAAEGRYKTAEIKLREDHAKELGKVIETNYKTNLKNADDHEKALDKVHADLAAARAESKRLGGLRIPAPTCPSGNAGSGTETTGTGQRDEEATATIALPERIETDLWSIVGRADEVTEQLRSCQSWIRANGFYGE